MTEAKLLYLDVKSTIGERIKTLMIAFGENQNSLSVKLGYGAPTTAKILKGKNNPGFDYLNAILTHYPQVNARWLLTGEGTML